MEEMTVEEHVEELRKRIIVIIIALLTACFFIYPFTDRMISSIKNFYLIEGVRIIALNPVETIIARINISIFTALFLISPLVIYELYMFIKPALIENEIRTLKNFSFFAYLLFFTGILFALFILLPLATKFLLRYTISSGITPMLSLSNLVNYIVLVAFIFGLVFETPIVVYLLVRFGITSSKEIAEKRRYVYVAVFIVGAMITDPSPLTQIMVALPMILLFELGLYFAKNYESSL